MIFYLLLYNLSDDDRLFVEKIYLDYGSYMYTVAYDVLKHGQDAEDAVNDAMCKIMKHLSKFEGTADRDICNMITICIRNIVKNKSIDNYNKKKKILRTQCDYYLKKDDSEDYTVREFCDKSYIPEDIVIKKEECEIIQKTLLGLTQDMQDAVNLVYMCGYSCVEAADFLGISDNAVRARLFKARNKLREALRKELCYNDKK
ncbi:MAG: sigma-70 family RNA polymerase sigma factor [Clostridia bacterium]|nr:sigma-70 family RNA polymerase sigma factor [Clostridia bacterium]